MNKIEKLRARMAEIGASLQAMEDAAGEAEYTQEQVEQTNALTTEFNELKSQLATAEKAQEAIAAATASAGRKTTPAAGGNLPSVKVEASHAQRFHGFGSAGEWLMAVKTFGQTGKMDQKFSNFAKESIGEDGGFLVPEELNQEIMKKMDADDSLMGRSTVIPVGGNNLTLTLDESVPWSSGVQAYWTGEGQQITESKPVFKQTTWRLQKIAALVKATDELLDDAIAMESYIKMAAPNAILHGVNKAIIAGNGIAKPLGLINSAFKVAVAAENMQSADTVNARNVAKMYSRMLPTSRPNAVWLINPAVEEQLRLMVDDNGNFIYMAPGSQLNQTPYGLLMGRPVLPLIGGMPALGDEGDIIFVDMKYYWMIRKSSGVKSAASIHLHFDKEITSFRFSLRVDGKCPFQSPITTEYGNFQMSAIVTLAAR